jgi:type II secretory pathway pseudopilin PulG
MKDNKSWTLIEMAMVMVLVAILAGIAIIRVNKVIEASRVSKAVSEVNVIKKAILAYYGDNYCFPAEVSAGVDPGLSPDYLDSWPASNPWGGEYDYNYGSYTNFNFDGTAGNEVYIAILKGSSNLPSDVCSEIDRLLDDGTTTSGKVRSDGSTYIYIYVAEGPNS